MLSIKLLLFVGQNAFIAITSCAGSVPVRPMRMAEVTADDAAGRPSLIAAGLRTGLFERTAALPLSLP